MLYIDLKRAVRSLLSLSRSLALYGMPIGHEIILLQDQWIDICLNYEQEKKNLIRTVLELSTCPWQKEGIYLN